MKHKIEILAPAGSYEGMKAAMNAGCDAVYIGGSSFGARAYANNLDEDTLLRAIDEAHIRDKKLYLTVNTLLKEKEHRTVLYSFLEKFYLQGLDAVIVQDVGVLHFIHEHFPELPIHASTQMTLTMAQGANLLKTNGVTRLVTSRELNLGEIKTIRENTDLEIETFVHGALCYCYSGQCLMSSIIGGRSGNRGRCAQPCRMPYQFYSDGKKLSSEQEKYLLSPKDINTIALIPELVEAGVNSFKIEGRMKRPEYAAAVAHTYRKYVDLYLQSGKEKFQNLLTGREYENDMLVLQDVYNRGGFSEGYLGTYHGRKMMSLSRPNHSGVLVGEVKEVKGSQVAITVKEKINAQDILEIRHKEEDGYEFTVKDSHNPGELLYTNVGRRTKKPVAGQKSQEGRHNNSSEPQIRVGDMVYRTKNNELLEYLEQEYLSKNARLGVQGVLTARTGEKLSLTLKSGAHKVTAYQDIVQEAMKQPMTKEKLLTPIEKTGETLYYFEELQLEADENIFVPVAWLNELRREAIRMLDETVTGSYRRAFHEVTERSEDQTFTPENRDVMEAIPSGTGHTLTEPNSSASEIVVSIHTREQFDVAVETPEITAIYAEYDTIEIKELIKMADFAAGNGKAFYLSLPHICRLKVYERLKKDLYEIIEKEAVSGFLVKNFEEIALLQSLWLKEDRRKEIILNYNMYIYNKEAKVFWREKGISRFTAPVELNYQELKSLGLEDCDLPVYGFLPLMISTQCLFASTKGCKRQANNGASSGTGLNGTMTDRLGKSFYVKTNCEDCYNVIYNGQVLALHKQASEIITLNPRSLRLDFTLEDANQMKRVLNIFTERFCYDKTDIGELSDYTTGHFRRGVE